MTVILPWGSLLAAVARPSVSILRKVRELCQPGAAFTVVWGSDPVRDREEMLRLGLPTLEAARLAADLAPRYAEAGFTLSSVGPMDPAALTRWPSTWVRRLGHGGARCFSKVEARAHGEDAPR